MNIPHSKTRRAAAGRRLTSPVSWLAAGMLVGLVSGLPVSAAPDDDRIPNAEGELRVVPIQHATLALEWNGRTILVDPVGDPKRFAGLGDPALILVTDIHGDHLNTETLQGLLKTATVFVAPSAVSEKLPPDLRSRLTVLNNGDQTRLGNLLVEALPAYNTTPERQKYHARGRGNGYLLTLAGQRVYISGDTEDIPEMGQLKNIDVAFLCMNLPYTMTVQQAAEAVRAFRPKIVYPYHCRGSDLEAFKAQVGDGTGIEVRIRDWYKP